MSDQEGAPTNDAAADDWAAALAEQANSEKAQPDERRAPDRPWSGSGNSNQGDYQSAEMENFNRETVNNGEAPLNLEAILDIPVTLSVVIGSTKISIRNLLQLNQGSVVELDRLAGEPLDVMVNGTLVAHGEVVVVNEKFGIRLTDVVSAQERVRKLQ